MALPRNEQGPLRLRSVHLFDNLHLENSSKHYITVTGTVFYFLKRLIRVRLQLQLQVLFTRNWNCNICDADGTKTTRKCQVTRYDTDRYTGELRDQEDRNNVEDEIVTQVTVSELPEQESRARSSEVRKVGR